jgi:hypothetical protein
VREGRRLKVFENENWVLRRIFGPKRGEVTGGGESYIMRSFFVLYSSPNIIRLTKSKIKGWAWHIARMGELHTGFWWKNLREREA